MIWSFPKLERSKAPVKNFLAIFVICKYVWIETTTSRYSLLVNSTPWIYNSVQYFPIAFPIVMRNWTVINKHCAFPYLKTRFQKKQPSETHTHTHKKNTKTRYICHPTIRNTPWAYLSSSPGSPPVSILLGPALSPPDIATPWTYGPLPRSPPPNGPAEPGELPEKLIEQGVSGNV